MSIEAKAALLGLTAALVLLGVTFGLSPFLQPATAAASKEQSTNTVSATGSPGLEGEATRGHSLFDHNCAHCHGDDARGDEGPSLYDLKKTGQIEYRGRHNQGDREMRCATVHFSPKSVAHDYLPSESFVTLTGNPPRRACFCPRHS